MQNLHHYMIHGTSRVRTTEEIAAHEKIAIERLEKTITKNPGVDIKYIVKYLKSDSSIAGNQLYPLYLGDDISYISITQAAKWNKIETNTLRTHMLRHPTSSIGDAIDKLRKNKSKKKAKDNLKKLADLHGIKVSLLEEMTDKFKDRLDMDQIVTLAVAQHKVDLHSSILQNSNAGLRKEKRGRHTVWVASYKDEDGQIRDMTTSEIAELEGLDRASLVKAINIHGDNKTIYEIVNEMVERVERTALYDLAYHYGIDRRMWIHRVNKHKGLPLDAIAEITRQDQSNLKLTPRKEREDPLPVIDGMSLSRFGYTNGTSSRTVIRRYDAGIEPKFTIGRRTPTSFYTYEDITLSMKELCMISGKSSAFIRRSIFENPNRNLVQHLEMTVDEFYAKLEQLKLLWTIPNNNHTHVRAKLLTLGSMTFSFVQLSHIAALSESTIRRRAKLTSNVLEITRMELENFMQRVHDIESKHANTLDAASLTTDFSEKLKQESRLQAIRNNFSEAKRNADYALNEIVGNEWIILNRTLSLSHIAIAPCSKCLSAPDVLNQDHEAKVQCKKCGNGAESKYTDALNAVLDWAQINTATITYQDINCFKGLDISKLTNQERTKLLDLLDTHYKNELECVNQLQAAFHYPKSLRKKYEVFSQTKKMEAKKRFEVNLRIVSILKQISMESSIWSHVF